MQQHPQPLPSLPPLLPSPLPPPLALRLHPSGQATGTTTERDKEEQGYIYSHRFLSLCSALLSAPPHAPNIWQDPQLFTVRSKEDRLQGLDQHAGEEDTVTEAEKARLVQQAKQDKKNFAPFKPPRLLSSSSLLPRSRRSLIKQFPGDHDPYINHEVGAKETDVPMHDHDDKTEDPDADDPKTHSLFCAVAASVVVSPLLSVPAAATLPSAQALRTVQATAASDTPHSPRTADGNTAPSPSCASSVPPSSPPRVSVSASTKLTTAQRCKKYRERMKQLKTQMPSPTLARKRQKTSTLTEVSANSQSHEQIITHLLAALDDPRIAARIKQIMTSTIQS